MVESAAIIWADGPSSAPANPSKAKIRAWGSYIETALAGAAAGATIYDSKADMVADTSQAANAMAWVLGDATAANNGVYQFNGTTWTRLGDLPYSYITATNAGAGTADAIVATTSIPIPATDGGALIALPIVADNTGTVTVAFNGGTALTIKTNSGNDIASGGLTSGMIVAGFVSGSTFRLLSDQASAAIQTAAEAAQTAAEAAAASVDYLVVADRTALKEVDTTAHTVIYLKETGREGTFQWNSSDLSAKVTADTAEGIYIAPASDATGASGAWVRQAGWHVTGVNVEWFGAIGDYNYTTDTGTVNTDAFQGASAVSALLGVDILIPSGYFLIDDIFTVPNRQRCVGMGRMNTKIVANSGFNLTAAAIVQLGTSGQNGTESADFAIDCIQPDSTTRADYIQYPPSLQFTGPRGKARRLRIACAWFGIDAASANCGGIVLEDIGLSAFSKQIEVQGATDSVRMNNIHNWPYNVGQTAQLTANQMTVFQDGSNTGWTIGTTSSVSDFQSVGCLIYGVAAPLSLGSSGSFGNFTDFKLDIVNGGISISDGRWNFSSPHISVAGATNFHVLYQTGGYVTFVSPQGNFASAATTTSIFNIRGGRFVGVGGIIPTGVANCSTFVFEATCQFSIVGMGFEKATNVAYTAPVINTRDTATGVIAGNSMTAKGTGSGVFHTASGTGTVTGIETNALNGYTVVSPWKSYTPTVSASSGAITTASASAHYLIRDNLCIVNYLITITTNGTGAGNLQVSLPVAASSAVTSGTGAGKQTTGSGLAVVATTSGSTAAIRDATGAYPGGDGTSIRLTVTYPVD